ncbi:MAG: hypothetical protein K0B08_05275 [Bacteroidales bacterium]|nr:hypothetical protein [Bacteroidales bacterium]
MIKFNLIAVPAYTFPVLIICCLFFYGCKKDKTPVMDDDVLENNYQGTLNVHFTNQMPQFSAIETMEVQVLKEGFVDISSGILQYYGETLVSDDSKIERKGEWELVPTGHLIREGGVMYVKIDANVLVNYDYTKVYAKDNNGNWVLVSEFYFSDKPNSDLSFEFMEAVLQGATCSTSDQFGSIAWTLQLVCIP